MSNKLPEFKLIAQGAEARLYRGFYLGKSVMIKERFQKKYRHSNLDARLTKERMKAEARAIIRAKSAGVSTPVIYLVDFNRRSIFMQYIENAVTLKNFIVQHFNNKDVNKLLEIVANAIGQTITKLHSNNIVHGDLTTSNILLKDATKLTNAKSANEVLDQLVLIDFGLAKVDSTVEDAAVDLYVFERSLSSAHAEVPKLFELVYKTYQKHFANKSQLKEIIIKYQDVKVRGRKRTMIG